MKEKHFILYSVLIHKRHSWLYNKNLEMEESAMAKCFSLNLYILCSRIIHEEKFHSQLAFQKRWKYICVCLCTFVKILTLKKSFFRPFQREKISPQITLHGILKCCNILACGLKEIQHFKPKYWFEMKNKMSKHYFRLFSLLICLTDLIALKVPIRI